MEDVILKKEYEGYTIEVIPDHDAGNPFTEWDGMPTLVLHRKSERHFGWSTDKDWVDTLDEAMRHLEASNAQWRLPQVLAIIDRWLRIFHDIPVTIPVGAMEHSGVMAYLGTGHPAGDEQGWDSGWVGWLFGTREQITEWGIDDDEVDKSLRADFEQFAAWVAGDVVGYRITDPDDTVIADCYGFYGSEQFDDETGSMMIECKAIVDTDIASRVQQLQLSIFPAVITVELPEFPA